MLDIALDSNGTLYGTRVSPTSPLGTGIDSDKPAFIIKVTPAGQVALAGNAGLVGTMLGALPGAISDIGRIAFIAPKTLVVGDLAGVLKIVVP